MSKTIIHSHMADALKYMTTAPVSDVRNVLSIVPDGTHARLHLDVYYVNTKGMADLVRKAERVPHTEVFCYTPGDPYNLAIVLWFRKTGYEQLREAYATLTMMGHRTVVLAKSFKEP